MHNKRKSHHTSRPKTKQPALIVNQLIDDNGKERKLRIGEAKCEGHFSGRIEMETIHCKQEIVSNPDANTPDMLMDIRVRPPRPRFSQSGSDTLH